MSAPLLLLAACTSEPVHVPADPPESAAPDTTVEFPPPNNGVQVGLGPFELGPYEEQYYCKITRLPNEVPLDVVALEHRASTTLHHFNIWGLTLGPEEDLEGPCDALWAETEMALASPLYASQDPTFYGAFPDGVAGLLPAGQRVLLEYHAVNPFETTVTTEAWLNAYAAEPGTVEHYANGLFGSHADLDIPPQSTVTVSKKCHVDVDMEVFVIGSHFHQRGTLFEVFALDDGGEAGELLYANTDWHSPELLMLEQPLHVPAGGGFEFRCHYDNPTDLSIGYGDSADDEMCMFAALYYPDQGFLVCSSTP